MIQGDPIALEDAIWFLNVFSCIIDPSKVALKMHGKNTISDLSFDPTKLLSTNKLGISPYNTRLQVGFRSNNISTAAAANSIQSINKAKLQFVDETLLNPTNRNIVVNSLECINEESITSATPDVSNQELKERAKSFYATQNRAVTKQDYESLIYQMPTKFGAVKRANIVNDPSSTNRDISLYVVSQDSNGKLANANQVVKNNIKNYLSHYIPINDTVTLKDALIVNFGIEFTVLNDKNYNSDTVLFSCHEALKGYFSDVLYIGEPLYLTRIYEVLNNVEGVYDVKRVKAFNKTNSSYSNVVYNLNSAISRDGTYIKVPKNVILELKYPNLDIKGMIK